MIKLYNTISRKVEPFRPSKPPRVTMYSCGPTVYNFPHIGNMRKYIADDVLVRVLTYNGYEVKRIINITDVGHLTQDEFDSGEDKIVTAARREGKSPLAIAEYYTQAFLADMQALNLTAPESYIKATDHISEMQSLIQTIIRRKHAYESNGSIYFDVGSFESYGKLSGNTIEELQERVRAGLKEEAFAEKKNPVDFALWIKAEPNHILQWPSPWGSGYPGWHIECAAMILKHLGKTIDIHTGGEDHIFPHHEDEIAEAEAATGKPLARYWMHVRHLTVEGQRMAKRTGTFVRVPDLASKNLHPLAFRYLALSTHYRSKLNFTWPALAAAQEGWLRYASALDRLREAQTSAKNDQGVPPELNARLKKIHASFRAAINDDLALPKALAVTSELIGVANTYLSGSASQTSLATINALLELLLNFDQVLGLLPQASLQLPQEERKHLQKLLQERFELRSAKKFKEADAVRGQITKLGFSIQDEPGGVRWTKTSNGHSGFQAKRG